MWEFQQKKNRTAWERIFIIAAVLLFLELIVFIWWKCFSIFQQQKINNQTEELQVREETLKWYESAVEYDRFLAIKDLEDKSIDMPWFEHIPKILSMFQDLRDLGNNSRNMITLSDFSVSLEEISLRWIITSLKTLYYNSDAFKALLDRFQELDFIKDMRIKTYEKVGSTNFEFILNANVVWNEQQWTDSK